MEDLPLESSVWPWLSFAIIPSTALVAIGLVIVLGMGWLFTIPVAALFFAAPTFLLLKALYDGRVLWPNLGWRIAKAVLLLAVAGGTAVAAVSWATQGDAVAQHLAPLALGVAGLATVLAAAVIGAHPEPARRQGAWRRWSRHELEAAQPWRKEPG